MYRFSILMACLALATPAVAQVPPLPYGGAPYGSQPSVGDIHRYEMQRLRDGADQREALARQQALDSRLTILELQAARRPAPVEPLPYRAPRTLEQERALRETATERSQTVTRGVGQIDAWLDRRPQ